MKTLYLRNVPDDVAERLERMARRAGLSLNTFAVRELAEISRQADNAALLAELPSLSVAAADIVGDIAAGRRGR
jgi:hypothetical protein